MRTACIIFFFLMILSIPAFCQKTLTQADFKLCLDNFGCSDSTLRLTKENLLSAKKITANFPWLDIRKLIIYMGEGNYTSEMMITIDEGNLISDKTKNVYFKRLMPGTPVSIEVEGYNRKGQRIPWSSLSILIIK